MGPTRKEQRIPAVVPVRIAAINDDGDPVNCLAHTLNVSRRGARIAGITVPLRAGTVIRITRGRATSNFRVAWIGTKETNSEKQIGVECLEVVSNFWGLDQLQPVSPEAEKEGLQRRDKRPAP